MSQGWAYNIAARVAYNIAAKMGVITLSQVWAADNGYNIFLLFSLYCQIIVVISQFEY